MGRRCNNRRVIRLQPSLTPGTIGVSYGWQARQRSSAVAASAEKRRSTKEKGATVAPFFSGSGSLTLLAALLLPALSSFLCHCAQSPLSVWDPNREGLSPSWQRRCLLARQPASVGARRVALPRARKICGQKIGGVSTRHPQSSDGAPLALFPALFLSALSSLLRHDSSLELAAQLI